MVNQAHEFMAQVEAGKGGRVFIRLPFDPDEAWGRRARHNVTGTVNGQKVRATLAPGPGFHLLSLGAAWRRDNGIGAGDRVSVSIWPEGPQQETMDAGLADALAAEPEAREFFDSLATFYRRNYVRWVEEAKRPETRARRIAETVRLLKNGVRQR